METVLMKTSFCFGFCIFSHVSCIGRRMAQDGYEMARRWPKHGPRWPQERPKTSTRDLGDIGATMGPLHCNVRPCPCGASLSHTPCAHACHLNRRAALAHPGIEVMHALRGLRGCAWRCGTFEAVAIVVHMRSVLRTWWRVRRVCTPCSRCRAAWVSLSTV